MNTKLRLRIRKNKVTMDQIREYQDTHCVSFTEAKELLENQEGPILQYWEKEWALGNMGTWKDVPTIIEFWNEQ